MEIQSNHLWTYQQNKCFYHLDPITYTWTKVEATIEFDQLHRSHYSSCVSGSTIYIVGGQKFQTNDVKKMSILELFQIEFIKTEMSLKVNKIKLKSTFEFDPCISSGTLQFLGQNLILFGGLCNSGRNENILLINLASNEVSKINKPDHLKERTKVYGSSSFTFGESVLILGGSLGPAGHTSGRQIFTLTNTN